MKKISISLLTLALAATATAQSFDRSARPKPGPAPEVKLGKTESFTLPNGMRVFVVENHKLPVVNVSIQLDIKPELEGNMTGYKDMVGELLTSGTKTRSKDQLNAAIDNIGARINANPEGIFGNSLKKYQNTLLELMSDIVINSDFKQDELEKLKKQTLSGLEAAKNNPDAMLSNVTSVVNFGANHPYGEVATNETVERITLDRCKGYYNTYFRPNVAYMAIVGDVTMAEMKPLIEKYFGKWAKANVPVASYSVPAGTKATKVALASREAAVQSVFNVTYPIRLEPGQPDVIKAKVANAILGGGSQGRLFLNLREAHGWTYGSYSTIQEDDEIGSFTAYAKCRNVVTDSAIREAINEMNRMRNEPVSEEELRNRITFMTGNFAIGLESPQTVAQYAINIERYKMPKDYYTNYLKNLSAVSVSDVQNMARKYITPENANIIVVGNGDEVAKKLEQFGKVEFYDNYGKPAVRTAQAAAPAGVTAQDVMKKYVAAIGGEKAITGIKDIKIVRTAEVQPGVNVTFIEMKTASGNMVRRVEGMGQVFQKMVLKGNKGWQEARGNKEDLSGDKLADALEHADIQAPLHPEKYGKYNLKGMEKVGGADAYVLEVTDNSGKKSNNYYDAATGLLVKQTATVETPQGEMTQITEFMDYKAVPGANGYKVAGTVQQQVGPQNFKAVLQTVEVNKGVKDSEFQ